MKRKWKNFFLDLLFPKFCLGCKKEGIYLCPDCQSILQVSEIHRPFRGQVLNDLYFPLGYTSPLLKKLVQSFKYYPFIKELSLPLSSLIKDHFQLLEEKPDFSDFFLIPIPLSIKRLKWRGFNQSKELAKRLVDFFNTPLLEDVLLKNQETPPQTKINPERRENNVSGVFLCQKPKKVKGRKVLLVDDIYTTGSTLKEAGQTLKRAGAKKVIGITVARAKPGQDFYY